MKTLEQLVWGRLEEVQKGRSGEPIGPSGHSSCFRQQAYNYHGIEPTDEVSKQAADIGTIIHDGLTYAIQNAPDYDPEKLDADVKIDIPGLPRPGKADVVDFVGRVVWDAKTVGDKSYNWQLKNGGPKEGYWDQADLYARGLAEKHGGEWTIGILLINRDSGARKEYFRDHDPVKAERLAWKIGNRHDALAGSAALLGTAGVEVDPLELVDAFPREGKGPGSFPCDWCQWKTLCWPTPSSPDRTPQSEAIADDPDGIGQYAEAYVSARETESKAKREKAEAAERLRGLDGSYRGPSGLTFKVSTTGGNPAPAAPDPDAMAAILDEMGLEVPYKKPRATPRRLTVDQVPED
jgi:hypothetical protein